MGEGEDLSDWVDKQMSAMRIDDLLARVPGAARPALIEGLRRHFDVPALDGGPVKVLRDMLAICRMSEDMQPDPKAARRLCVGLLLDAISGPPCGVPSPDGDAVARPVPAGPKRENAVPVQAGTGRHSGATSGDASQAPIGSSGAAEGQSTLVIFPDWTEPPALCGDYLASLAPGPGADAGEAALGVWIAGRPADPYAFAIGHGDFSDADYDRMVDMEAEFFSNPADLLARHGHTMARSKPLQFPHRPSGRAALAHIAKKQQFEPRPDAVILGLFRDALAGVLRRYWPEKSRAMARAGSRLHVGPALLAHLRLADALEQQWLEQAGGTVSGHRQDMRGTIHPDGAMPPGLVFARMGYLHFACGWPAEDCLFEALADRRYAESIRGLDDGRTDEVSRNFDATFLADPWRPIRQGSIDHHETPDFDPTPSL